MTESQTEADITRQSVNQSRFLKACRGERPDCTPIWLMRQAGRYMSEYRAIRERYSMLEVIQTPELAAEVTMQPIQRFDLDAAIIFSDILPPLIGMGLPLDFVKGVGPKIDAPIDSPEDVSRLTTPPMAEVMASTIKAIQIVCRELEPRGIPLIGFSGAPFTLACYAIQGSGSKMYERAKAFMYQHPESWAQLMDKLVSVVTDYLSEQARAGASVLQLFDSWAGILSRSDYRRFIQPYNSNILEKLKQSFPQVPLINFSTGTSTHLDEVARCGGDVIGVDWRVPIDRLRPLTGERVVQGNLDPTVLLGPWSEIKYQVDAILKAAKGERHIFNLGHGILPQTPIESVEKLVDYVHQATA